LPHAVIDLGEGKRGRYFRRRSDRQIGDGTRVVCDERTWGVISRTNGEHWTRNEPSPAANDFDGCEYVWHGRVSPFFSDVSQTIISAGLGNKKNRRGTDHSRIRWRLGWHRGIPL
jgi:hypothetical protein